MVFGFYLQKTTFVFLLVKKRIISSVLLCAFAIIFLHSIIPHHHHEDAATEQNTGHHDNYNDDLDNNFLGQIFSHFQHESSSGITYQTSSPTFQCSKFGIDKEAILFTQYVITQLLKPPIKHTEHNSFAFTPFSYLASSRFRGPPMA